MIPYCKKSGILTTRKTYYISECMRSIGKMSITYDETISDRFEGYTNLVSVSVCEDFIKIGLERAE